MRPFRLLPLAAATALWYLRSVHRWRDPVRGGVAPPGGVLSPADGLLSFVRRVDGGMVSAEGTGTPLRLADLLGVPAGGDGWLLGIHCGPLDVHYVYQPAAGTVSTVWRAEGHNRPLQGAAALLGTLAGRPTDLLGSRGTLDNERLAVTVRGASGDLTVTLVAPGAALDATLFLRPGDPARPGHKLALLPEGGLVLLFLPTGLTPRVAVGDRMQGARTEVASAAV